MNGDEVGMHPLLALDETLAGGRTMDGCYRVGIMGGCGTGCPVYLAKQCEHQEEMSLDRDAEKV